MSGSTKADPSCGRWPVWPGRARVHASPNLVLVSPQLKEAAAWRRSARRFCHVVVVCGRALSELRGERGGWSLKLIAPDNVALRRTLKRVRQILVDVLPQLGERSTRKL